MKYFLICTSLLLLCCTNALADDSKAVSLGQQVIHDCTKKTPSHLQEMNCEGDEKEALKKKMQEAYNLALMKAKERDKSEIADHDEPYSYAEKNLKASQKAFEHYMNKECYRQGRFLAGGNGEDDVVWGCEVDMQNERIQALNRKYE